MIFRVEKKSLEEREKIERSKRFLCERFRNVSTINYSNDGGKKKRRVVEVNSSLTFD